MPDCIRLKNISKTYYMGEHAVHALRTVSLSIQQGDFVAIMGPSGSGKSTLMHVLGLLDAPDQGEYALFEKPIVSFDDEARAYLRNRIMGYVFQQFHLLPRVPARENVGLPLMYAGVASTEIEKRALAALTATGLLDRSHHHPNALSGGQQQRVAIARALVTNPLVLFADEPTGNLDSKSQEDILRILVDLNTQGKTIVMVTHEEEVAHYARRIIRMRDGEIVGDTEKYPLKSIAFPPDMQSFSGAHAKTGKAEVGDHVRQAIRAIVRNKVRSFLSMMGILIGVASVIAMLALGEGAKESIKDQLASLGSNLLFIRPGTSRVQGVSMESGAAVRFSPQDFASLMKMTDYVKNVSPQVSGSVQAVYGDTNWRTRVSGVATAYEIMRASKPTVGRFFTEEEVRKRERVVLLGTTVVEKLFGDEDPVGKTIKVDRGNFTVLGILPSKGANAFRDQDDEILVPITTAMYRVLGKDYYDALFVEVRDAALMSEAETAIRNLLAKRYRLDPEDTEALRIRNLSEIGNALEGTTQTMSWLLGSIAAISLAVGGIGIMNIMLVSVTERTREIGLRKAIGARVKDILMQFLIEAVVMTLTGGIVGVIVGAGVAQILSVSAGWATKVTMSSVILATVFSAGVGLVFGFWPARQAAHLNPIEALRYE